MLRPGLAGQVRFTTRRWPLNHTLAPQRTPIVGPSDLGAANRSDTRTLAVEAAESYDRTCTLLENTFTCRMGARHTDRASRPG